MSKRFHIESKQKRNPPEIHRLFRNRQDNRTPLRQKQINQDGAVRYRFQPAFEARNLIFFSLYLFGLSIDC